MRDRFAKYLLVRFRNGGRNLSGCDCWGLVLLIYRAEFGIELPDYAISCKDPMAIDGAVTDQRPAWRRIETPAVPCAVLMRNDAHDPKLCNHIGVYVGDGRMIHTLAASGAMRTRIDDPIWSTKIEGYYVPAG